MPLWALWCSPRSSRSRWNLCIAFFSKCCCWDGAWLRLEHIKGLCQGNPELPRGSNPGGLCPKQSRCEAPEEHRAVPTGLRGWDNPDFPLSPRCAPQSCVIPGNLPQGLLLSPAPAQPGPAGINSITGIRSTGIHWDPPPLPSFPVIPCQGQTFLPTLSMPRGMLSPPCTSSLAVPNPPVSPSHPGEPGRARSRQCQPFPRIQQDPGAPFQPLSIPLPHGMDKETQGGS